MRNITYSDLKNVILKIRLFSTRIFFYLKKVQNVSINFELGKLGSRQFERK